eukprot:GEMP01072304.1.p1 GENE.GEMP01072304.1~~GEMP01072304.1.p1  ORF type:complete len:147 (+),score=21.79 GEMP01072304.1:52-492(+)
MNQESDCGIFEQWLNEVQRVGPEDLNRCSFPSVECYLNLVTASRTELGAAQTLWCELCGCEGMGGHFTWLAISLVLEVAAIGIFQLFSKSEHKFLHVLTFGLLLRGILLPKFPHCLLAVGYLVMGCDGYFCFIEKQVGGERHPSHC